ncbi:MAG: hypothetical protein ACLUFN_08290 [Eubacterium sp.]
MSKIEEVLSCMNEELQAVFNTLDINILSRINEIRVRRNNKLIIVIKNTSYFLDYNGDLYDYPSNNAVTVNGECFDKLFMCLCDYSIYSNMDNLKKGFLTLSNGARVGVASTAVYDNYGLMSVKDITSINIRIPGEVKGCADGILNFLYVTSFPSIIVAGKPNSGKTTLLRDLARGLSNGFNNRYAKVAIVDERNEIAGKQNDNLTMDIGINTDVITSFSKAEGIELATRTLSPEMIICDEISTIKEVQSILYAFSSGIAFALSVHISSRDDLLRKPIIKTLLATRQFSYIVLLDNYTYKPIIIEAEEIYNEICRNDNSNNIVNEFGINFI